jgi:hypothetical protein
LICYALCGTDITTGAQYATFTCGRQDFELRTDDSGKPYVCKFSSELTKIHQGIRNEQYKAEGGRMYETNTQMCPVQSFLKYIRKRNHNCDAFWQRPRDSFDDDAIWFEKKPLGRNPLSQMMADISKAAKLSRVYTNHCIRATCITLLSEAGFEGRHIITLSGHRSEEGIKSYCRDTSEEQKRDMSKSISAFTTVVNDTVRQSSVVENVSDTVRQSSFVENAGPSTSTAAVRTDPNETLHQSNIVRNSDTSVLLDGNFDMDFDESVSDNELVLSASHTEILLIKIAEHELQQPRDITNEHPPQQVSSYTQKDMFGGTSRTLFQNCTVNINMQQ